MMNKNLIAALSGIIFESYNNTLYGFFAISLAHLFFPSNLTLNPFIGSLLTFAAGYTLRPIGGLIFGFIGDKKGRRVSLRLSMLFTAIPVLMIGFLPSYDSIGLAAPFILMICRLIQGISSGSDYTGVIIYVAEQKGINNKTFITCFLVCCGFIGALVGIFVSFFLTSSLSFSWGWRLSFIFGGLMSLMIYFLRSRMKETPQFNEIARKDKQNPFLSLLKNDKQQFTAGCILGGANLVPIYIATVYLNLEFKRLYNFSISQILLNNFLILSFGAILVLLSATLIKKFNERVVMKVAMGWFILFSIPMYKWAIQDSSPSSLFLLQIFIMMADAPQIAALAIFLPKLFPTNRRYSGLGLSYSLGQALMGGTTPLIAAYLVYATDQPWAPSYFLCVTSLLYLIAIIKTETKILKNI